MTKEMDNILQKTAAYIEAAQTAIDQNNEARNAFRQRMQKSASLLASRGLVDKERVTALVDKIAADETCVWDIVDRLALSLQADGLGTAEKVAAQKDMDPFERLYRFGDSRADSRIPGMVE